MAAALEGDRSEMYERDRYFYYEAWDYVLYMGVYVALPVVILLYGSNEDKFDFLWALVSVTTGIIYDCYGKYQKGKKCEVNKYAVIVGASQVVLLLIVLCTFGRLAMGLELGMLYVLPFFLMVVPAISAAYQLYRLKLEESSTNKAINCKKGCIK